MPTSRDERRAATRMRIIDAAREEFATAGSERATVRGIAARAGVDPSLVMQHFGSKAALFAVAAGLPAHDDVEAPEHLTAVLNGRLDELPAEAHVLLRSMLTSPEAAAVMRDYLQDRIDRLAGPDPDATTEARAVVVATSILGLTIARHFLDLESFERVPTSVIAAVAEAMLSAGVDVSEGPRGDA